MNYVFYCLLFSVALLLQLTIIPLFAIHDTIPDLILIVVIATTLQQGRVFAIVCGFVAGVIFDAFGTGLVGLSSMSYSAAAYVIGILGDEQLERRITIVFSIFLAAMLCHGLLYYTILLLGTEIGFWNTFVQYVIPSTVYTMVFVVIMHLILPKYLWGIRMARK